MYWAILVALAAASLLAVHFYWRRRFLERERMARREVDHLKQQQLQAASQSQSQQEALFDSMAEGMLLLDQAGRIQLANRAFSSLFGLTIDVRSRTIMEALRLHELADLVDFLGTQRQVLGYELKLLRPKERWLQVNGAAILNGDGRRHGTILVFHDLTRLKQLERVRQEFVANVSHELRTPLSLIQGYLETLLGGAKDNPELSTRFLQTIERNAERLRLLIEDLLTISELESGRLQLELQPVPLRAVVEKVLADFKSRAAAKQIALVDKTPAISVRADPARIEQVLCNLVDNAIKYGRPQGSVTLAARPTEPGQVEVAVHDDGPGIPSESLERIFERFYRVDKARSREQGGTGLGLAIVKHIVQSHGGRSWAESQVGRGASFFFTLPQAAAGQPEVLIPQSGIAR
jgi:two-component system phosphate regulon sensor histidine kinase PhoR